MERLYEHFTVCEWPLTGKLPDYGGMDYVLGAKKTDSFVQFASCGEEWAMAPGYAHFCLGHIPVRG